jgi:hypothetical protein
MVYSDVCWHFAPGTPRERATVVDASLIKEKKAIQDTVG